MNNKLNIIHDSGFVDLILKNIINLYWNVFSQTPLHFAAVYGKKECCEVLLQYGADKNIQNVSYFYCFDWDKQRDKDRNREREREEGSEKWRDMKRERERLTNIIMTHKIGCVWYFGICVWFSILE